MKDERKCNHASLMWEQRCPACGTTKVERVVARLTKKGLFK